MGLYPPPAELISHRMRMNTFLGKWLEYLASAATAWPRCAAMPMASVRPPNAACRWCADRP